MSGDKSTTCIKTGPTSACDTSGQKLTAEKTDVSGLQLILHRLCVQLGERINVTPELLDSIPTTTYSRSTMRWIQDNAQHGEATEEYSTDSTIVYWDSAPPKSRKKRKYLLKRSCLLRKQALLVHLFPLTLKLVFMVFDVDAEGTIISVKYLAVEKVFQTLVIGTVTTEYAMHLFFAVASASKCILLQVHTGIIYTPTMKTNLNADSAIVLFHFSVE